MKTPKKAIITGISGQDGYHLSKILLDLGFQVVGLTRDKAKNKNRALDERIEIVESNYSKTNIAEILSSVNPDHIYHLAGQPYVGKSWTIIDETTEASALIAIKILEAIVERDKEVKFFNASSSEIFLDSAELLLESSPKEPTTPYGCAKLYSHTMTKAFRENYNLFAINGILFNHESFKREDDFLSKKLVKGVVDIYTKVKSNLRLGNLDIIRDWGAAEDYMAVLPMIMNLKSPEDFNICSSSGRSVRDIVEYSFSLLHMDYKEHTEIDRNLVRNKEKIQVIGSNKKIFTALGWKPKKTIEDVIKEMMREEIKSRGLNELF